jgi:hypothetical protein
MPNIFESLFSKLELTPKNNRWKWVTLSLIIRPGRHVWKGDRGAVQESRENSEGCDGGVEDLHCDLTVCWFNEEQGVVVGWSRTSWRLSRPLTDSHEYRPSQDIYPYYTVPASSSLTRQSLVSPGLPQDYSPFFPIVGPSGYSFFGFLNNLIFTLCGC